MICQPAWQLAMTIGLPSASGWRLATSSRKTASARQTSSIVWPGNGLRQEADEIDRVAGAQRHADFAVGLHAADSGTVPGARVDDDDRRLRRIDRHVRRRDDAHEQVIDRPIQLPAVEHDFGLEAQHMRRLLRRLRDVNVAALVQRLEETARRAATRPSSTAANGPKRIESCGHEPSSRARLSS